MENNAAFEKWLKHLSPSEGGWADVKGDAGGKTNRGVTIATWRDYAPKLFGLQGTENELANMTQAQWREISWQYFRDSHAPKVTHEGLAICMADNHYHGGLGWCLQRALNNVGANLVVDGAIGAKTIAALRAVVADRKESSLRIALLTARMSMLMAQAARPDQALFRQGFKNRINNLAAYTGGWEAN